jgi:hypothetical protein
MGATEGKKHTLGVIRKIDKNFLFCEGNIRKLTLCVNKKCIVTYSVSGLWDRGSGFKCSEKVMIGVFQADMVEEIAFN